MLFTGVYQLFSAFARSREVGAWTISTTNHLRNGLMLLRGEISKASKPEVVSQKGTNLFDTGNGDREKFLYVPATIPFKKGFDGGDEKILHFFISQTGKSGLPGETDVPPEVVSGALFIEGKKLIYRRIIDSQPADVASKTKEITQIIAENPSEIEISLREVADPNELSVGNRNFVTIKVSANHPKYPKTSVTETMEAPFEVPVQKGGMP
jgi:hypothetical protein